MNKGTTCDDCGKAIAWGQRSDDGKPLDNKNRLKRCFTCTGKRRDARKPK